jgi:hypothetical protein
MRLISYRKNGETGVGAMLDEVSAVALSEAAPDLPGTYKKILELEDGLQRVRGAVDGRTADFALDDIAMGTPGALPPEPGYVASPQDSDRIPGRTRMKPGDVVEVEISGIGTLRNPIVASD